MLFVVSVSSFVSLHFYPVVNNLDFSVLIVFDMSRLPWIFMDP